MGTQKRLLLLLAFLSLAGRPARAAKSSDAAAVADLVRSLSNLPPSWNAGADPCGGGAPWDGLACDGSTGRVTDINLPRRSISGKLPNSISSLSSLRSLQLQNNAISGPLPSLSGLASLTRLALDSNAFSSVPADFLSGVPSLEYLSLDNIPFAPWAVPDAIGGCASLQVFSASNASITGTFPAVLANLSSLRTLRLSYNNLTGGLPAGLAGLVSLESLQVNNQESGAMLSGPIDVVAAIQSLKLVWLQSNAFSGPIPDLNRSVLESFNVRDNQLTGVVPASLSGLQSLKNASLSNNYFQGPMPEFGSGVSADVSDGNGFCGTKPGPCDAQVTLLLEVAGGFGYPLQLAESWKGNDPCNGWLGVTCDLATKVITMITLVNRNLSGTISPAIANLTGLTKLTLSNNQLTGMIPDSLTELQQLTLVDVSNNTLTGEVPKFKPSVKVLAGGNRFGESGTDGGGKDGSSGDASSLRSGSDSAAKSGARAGTIIGVLVAVIVLLTCIGLFLRYRHKRNVEKCPFPTKSSPTEPEMVKVAVVGANENNNGCGAGLNELYSHVSSQTMSVTNLFESQGMHMSIEALCKATNNFSEDLILGRGGFGVVYRGDLNGSLVAVKRTDSGIMGTKGQEEFIAEIDVLRKVRHRHLVALLGYGNDGKERLLVYEYMSGGTLGEHLFDLQQSGYPPLTWAQRMTIALDVARGIEYLHGLALETFIHRDLKPSNILLDQNMRAKVSDFGLVKLAKDTDKSMLTRVAGTFGYLAPEYATTGKITTKVDVYAYGVILMEMIAGRKVLDNTLPNEESHLVTIFRRNMLDKERFMKFVDPTLELYADAWNSLMEVADLARHCTAREPYQRPDMSHCVNRLSSLMDQWKPTNVEEDDFDDTSMELNQRLERWRSEESSITDSFSTQSNTRRYA